jgi:hypothetical protein
MEISTAEITVLLLTEFNVTSAEDIFLISNCVWNIKSGLSRVDGAAVSEGRAVAVGLMLGTADGADV